VLAAVTVLGLVVGATALAAQHPTGPKAAAQAAAPLPTLPPPPGTTERESVSSNGRQGNTASGGASDIFTAMNGNQAISTDGRWVAFASTASNLVPNTPTPAGGLFLRDRQSGTTIAIPWLGGGVFPAGTVAAEPAISADGGVIAFTAILTSGQVPGLSAGQTPEPFVLTWDRKSNATEVVSIDATGAPTPGYQPAISADGNSVAYTRWYVAPPPPTPTPDTTGPSITNINVLNGVFNIEDGSFCAGIPASTVIRATVSDPSGLQFPTPTLYFVEPGNGPIHTQQMTYNIFDHMYRSTITAVSAWPDGQIYYWITATDTVGNSSTVNPDPSQAIFNTTCIP